MRKIVVLLIAVVAAFALSGTAFAGTLAGGAVDGGISESKAVSIALKDAGLSKGKVYGLEIEQGKSAYEVEFAKKGARTEFEYEIDKASGKILEKSVDYTYKRNSSKAKIGKSAALKKVAKFSGIKNSVVKKGSCTYKYRKQEGRYTVKFSYKGYKYEYKLLAPTGKILGWEKELIRK